MSFQEGPAENQSIVHVPVPRTSNRQLLCDEQRKVARAIDSRVQPPSQTLNLNTQEEFSFDGKEFNVPYYCWTIARKNSSFDQTVPTYSAYRMNVRAEAGVAIRKTTETYLPPIDSKVCFSESTLPNV